MTDTDTTVAPTARHDRWTHLNITLHWLIVVLLIAQFFDSEWMGPLFDASNEGKSATGATLILGYTHMILGGLIFLAIALRLWDRQTHGRPAHRSGEPGWASSLARLTHAALYALLFAMPIAGAAAWFTGSETVATLHKWGWTALMIVAALHVVGALAEHFWFRTDVLRRMMPGQGRSS
ncbi:cytochrome b561 [Palleronia aestuarii]|uniref:Cytochrome b561 n=1 Tax=Palleronia aestuarii TaxID=568105 RepID=A0A2W7NPU8_9RHOB|nr:cytochrome b/b6 domain-containing protein [Palleronia aestuarii]PZX15276.1 cytochrome b561 [Palleronia aestuarii]